MSIHIIVDGYNMIRHSSKLEKLDRKDIGLGRNALINILVKYKRLKKHSITVVFDGASISDLYSQRDIVNGIKIIFTRNNETADQFICSMVKKEKHRALVVSCDREIINFAESYGASIINSPYFEEKVVKTINCISSKNSRFENTYKKGRFITRKKGPNKRLPKSERKQQIRINKL